MRWAVIDSSVYIGHWERGLYEDTLTTVRKAFIVRHSAVVLSELRRGARTRPAQRLVDALAALAPGPWEPSADDWWKAGRLIRMIGDGQGWEIGKRREFQNDALIALTARRQGATVVTSNREDFLLLSEATGVRVLYPT